MQKTVSKRFLSLVKRGQPDECWPWLGPTRTRTGYGACNLYKKDEYAHRVAYELEYGPIPTGLVVDHLCRNPSCVNPAHLEAVTQKENVRRGIGNGSQTHCPQGHEYSDGNTYRDTLNRRYCRTCRSAANKRSYLRRLHPAREQTRLSPVID